MLKFVPNVTRSLPENKNWLTQADVLKNSDSGLIAVRKNRRTNKNKNPAAYSRRDFLFYLRQRSAESRAVVEADFPAA